MHTLISDRCWSLGTAERGDTSFTWEAVCASWLIRLQVPGQQGHEQRKRLRKNVCGRNNAPQSCFLTSTHSQLASHSEQCCPERISQLKRFLSQLYYWAHNFTLGYLLSICISYYIRWFLWLHFCLFVCFVLRQGSHILGWPPTC